MTRRALVFLLLSLALATVPLVAQPQRLNLDLVGDAQDALDSGWACTTWHVLWPDEQYCRIEHLDYIEGDGQLKACNFAWFNGRRYHIDWVGPTYFLDCLGIVAEPAGDPTSDSPVCQIWEEVRPEHGRQYHVDDWKDNDGSGDVSACDIVVLDGMVCHVQRVGLNIIISPAAAPTHGAQ